MLHARSARTLSIEAHPSFALLFHGYPDFLFKHPPSMMLWGQQVLTCSWVLDALVPLSVVENRQQAEPGRVPVAHCPWTA